MQVIHNLIRFCPDLVMLKNPQVAKDQVEPRHLKKVFRCLK